MESTENNKLIAEFLNMIPASNETYPQLFRFEDNDEWFTSEELKFNSDWNWLMEVVERIEETEIDNNILMLESIGNMAKFIFDDGCRFLSDCIGETKIEAVYNAVVSFIKWYNLQEK